MLLVAGLPQTLITASELLNKDVRDLLQRSRARDAELAQLSRERNAQLAQPWREHAVQGRKFEELRWMVNELMTQKQMDSQPP